ERAVDGPGREPAGAEGRVRLTGGGDARQGDAEGRGVGIERGAGRGEGAVRLQRDVAEQHGGEARAPAAVAEGDVERAAGGEAHAAAGGAADDRLAAADNASARRDRDAAGR